MTLHMKAAALAAVLATCVGTPLSAAAAPYTAVGVQNDVPVDTVLNGGWEVIYRGSYEHSFSLTQVLAATYDDTHVMLASLNGDSTSFDVLAYATKAEITRLTALNEVHVANGVGWYYNDRSLGFAGLGDEIHQEWADTAGLAGWSEDDPDAVDERDRLSWHTGVAGEVTTGWRSGANIWLGYEGNWDRLILVQTIVPPVPAVPEASTYALMVTGLCVVGALRRRQSTRLAT